MSVTIPSIDWDQHGEVKSLWQVRRGYRWGHTFRHHESGPHAVNPVELAYDLSLDAFRIEVSGGFSKHLAVDPVIIVPALELDPDLRWVTYNPLDEPGLCRKFARLKEPMQCMEFAWRYGSLGLGVMGFDENKLECYAEPLNLWMSEASAFRFCLGVAKLFHGPETRRDYDRFMRSFDELCDAERPYQEMTMDISGLSGLITVLRSSIDILSHVREAGYREDLKLLMLKSVLRYLNARIRVYVSVQVWPSDLRHVIVVRHLYGALIFDLAHMVAGNFASERFCMGCHAPLNPESRSDRQFCSRSCQQRLYRRRQQRTQLLSRDALT